MRFRAPCPFSIESRWVTQNHVWFMLHIILNHLWFLVNHVWITPGRLSIAPGTCRLNHVESLRITCDSCSIMNAFSGTVPIFDRITLSHFDSHFTVNQVWFIVNRVWIIHHLFAGDGPVVSSGNKLRMKSGLCMATMLIVYPLGIGQTRYALH